MNHYSTNPRVLHSDHMQCEYAYISKLTFESKIVHFCQFKHGLFGIPHWIALYQLVNESQLMTIWMSDLGEPPYSTAASIKKSHYFRSYLNPKKNKQ